MIKNYNFNSISLNIDDGILETLFDYNSRETFNILNYDIKDLPSGLCANNKNIKEVILPKNLQTIGESAFSDCSSLEKISIPKSVKKIGSKFLNNTPVYKDEQNWSGNVFNKDGWALAFRGGAIVIPNTVTKLISNIATFKRDITSIHFPNTITEIPDEFVYYLTAVTSVTFEANSKLERIGASALYCPNLTEIRLPDSIKYLGSYSVGYSSIKKVYITNLKNFCNIEKDLNVFGSSAKYDIYLNNTILKEVIIPSELDVLKQYVFSESNIEKVKIPTSIKKIETGAFRQCSKLSNIEFLGTVAEWKSIDKEYNWFYQIQATYVQCTDGQVAI